MPELEEVLEEPVAEPPKPRIGRPPGSKNKNTATVTLEDGATEPPKRRRRRRTSTEGLLEADDVTALITTAHNIPAAVLKLDELRVEDEQVEPYANDIAKYINSKLPEVAKVAKDSVPLIGLFTYLGLVEAPTLINTYKEVQSKLRERQSQASPQSQQETQPQENEQERPPTGLSMLDKLGTV